jgi:RNA polymerase sigma-70 factor (ECF subfamily)
MAENESGFSDSEAVARAFRAGRSAAVREVGERIARIVSYRGLRIPVQDRGDIEQEVMSQIWQAANRPSFDPAGGFWAFVELVTTRRCIDWLRLQKVVVEIDQGMTDNHSGPLDETLDRERVRLGRAALAELAAPCRQLIYQHAGLGRSYAEIAQLTGKSEGALRVQMHRCLQRAQEAVEHLKAKGPRKDADHDES